MLLSTSVHHLVDKLGAELGYLMSEDTGYDVEDCITLATRGLTTGKQATRC